MFYTTPEILLIGHVCHDKTGSGYTPGGTCFYASLLAREFGIDTAVFSSFGNDFLFTSMFKGIKLETHPSPYTTVFENKIIKGQRAQWLHKRAKDLRPDYMPVEWRSAPVVLLGPIVNEVSFDFIDIFPDSLLCVCPQGWMRQWDEKGRVSAKKLDSWSRLAKADIISLSEQDLMFDENEINRISDIAHILLVTRGKRGVTVFKKGKRKDYPAFPANEVDSTGAGDLFAAAFTLHFCKTAEIHSSVVFALATSATSVEHPGIHSIPTKGRILSKLIEGNELGLL